MKLGNLCSAELKKQLFAVAQSPWEKLTPDKRMKATKSYIIRHRLGEKVSKFIRANGESFNLAKTLKPREASQWICDHAMALAGEQSFKPMKAFHGSLLEVFTFHGMDESRKQELYAAFDGFNLQ